jgi:ribosomal protein S18 acetylase RimI-like enzyme
MNRWAIEIYDKQLPVKELLEFIEENLKLRGFPSPMYWVSKRQVQECRKNNEIFLAMQGNKMLGCIIIIGSRIEILCVRKYYRKRGIGKALVNYAIEFLKQDKRRKYVKVESLHDFKAKQFYDKLGFTQYDVNDYDYTWHLQKAL